MMNSYYKNIYRLGLHRDIMSIARFKKTCEFIASGNIFTLEVGSGGGPFTVEILEKKNLLTVVEINKLTAEKTEKKIKKLYPNSGSKVIVGHINDVTLTGLFHQIILLETLEHIKDDRAALKKLARHLEPGGRMIISTPLASYGKLSSDFIVNIENGGHVRIGYEGKELDKYLQDVGMVTVKRIYYGGWLSRLLSELQRLIGRIFPSRCSAVLNIVVSVFYFLVGFVDNISTKKPYGQITLAIKVDAN